MITPEEFPYITSIHVNDCYAYQNFDIHLHDYKPAKPFSHLILTGRNGSGKSTILMGIEHCAKASRVVWPSAFSNQFVDLSFRNLNQTNPFGTFILEGQTSVYASFGATRLSNKPYPVETPIKDEALDTQLVSSGSELTAQLFKQYLVNRKVAQAFSQLKKQADLVQNIDLFFESIEKALNGVFDGQLIEIVFEENSYEFYLRLKDGRRLTFDILPEGFSALLSILMDLFIRVDIIRKQVNDFSYDPCGIVLIDEPETHLHLQLQEQVLPLLTTLFPNIQFIAATHSPAVIASIKNATIFDLTTKETRSDEVVGRSYSELMMGHFGLENEYSGEADKILYQINQAVQQFNDDPDKLRAALREIRTENADYISPTIEVELEVILAKANAKFLAHQ